MANFQTPPYFAHLTPPNSIEKVNSIHVRLAVLENELKHQCAATAAAKLEIQHLKESNHALICTLLDGTTFENRTSKDTFIHLLKDVLKIVGNTGVKTTEQTVSVDGGHLLDLQDNDVFQRTLQNSTVYNYGEVNEIQLSDPLGGAAPLEWNNGRFVVDGHPNVYEQQHNLILNNFVSDIDSCGLEDMLSDENSGGQTTRASVGGKLRIGKGKGSASKPESGTALMNGGGEALRTFPKKQSMSREDNSKQNPQLQASGREKSDVGDGMDPRLGTMVLFSTEGGEILKANSGALLGDDAGVSPYGPAHRNLEGLLTSPLNDESFKPDVCEIGPSGKHTSEGSAYSLETKSHPTALIRLSSGKRERIVDPFLWKSTEELNGAIRRNQEQAGYCDLKNPDFFLHGLQYKPPLPESSSFRTILIRNLPANITQKQFLSKIRGGAVYSATLFKSIKRTDPASATVIFFSHLAAKNYAAHATTHRIPFSDHPAHIQLLQSATWPLTAFARRRLGDGRTRVLLLTEFRHLDVTITTLKRDIAGGYAIRRDGIEYMRFVGEDLLISFCSVDLASNTINLLMSRPMYGGRGLDIRFLRDPCEGPLTEVDFDMPKSTRKEDVMFSVDEELSLGFSHTLGLNRKSIIELKYDEEVDSIAVPAFGSAWKTASTKDAHVGFKDDVSVIPPVSRLIPTGPRPIPTGPSKKSSPSPSKVLRRTPLTSSRQRPANPNLKSSPSLSKATKPDERKLSWAEEMEAEEEERAKEANKSPKAKKEAGCDFLTPPRNGRRASRSNAAGMKSPAAARNRSQGLDGSRSRSRSARVSERERVKIRAMKGDPNLTSNSSPYGPYEISSVVTAGLEAPPSTPISVPVSHTALSSPEESELTLLVGDSSGNSNSQSAIVQVHSGMTPDSSTAIPSPASKLSTLMPSPFGAATTDIVHTTVEVTLPRRPAVAQTSKLPFRGLNTSKFAVEETGAVERGISVQTDQKGAKSEFMDRDSQEELWKRTTDEKDVEKLSKEMYDLTKASKTAESETNDHSDSEIGDPDHDSLSEGYSY